MPGAAGTAGLYQEFASLYASGGYSRYSESMARFLPRVLRKFHARPRTVLDLACGEGTFAIILAKKGFQVTGVDQSGRMIALARARARRERSKIPFIVKDIRRLTIKGRFDLATCWYDSLNYLLKLGDLEQAITNAARALKPHGLFVFDMNTREGLAVRWQQYPAVIQQDTRTSFEVHRPSFDAEHDIATLKITGFMKKGQGWARMDESHRERAYSLNQIRRCLRRAGLTELACWSSFRRMTPFRKDTGRVWFVARK